ncbi:MAG: GntR family transcriptional regulator [Candidatus Sericytochromatia bacterium]
MIFSINPEFGTPIYLQLMDQIRHAIAIGLFRPGDSLPTIRELALQLRVNPNTVAKAIRELEREGLLVTRVGKGSFISEQAPGQAGQDQLTKGQAIASQYGQDMHWLGFDCDGAVKLVRQNWKEENT